MYDTSRIDKPTKNLFNAIFELQILSEYDPITDKLKKELKEVFSDVEEKNGKKTLESISYYPNGLCEWSAKEQSVILEPWENKTKAKEKKNTNYAIVKEYNILWYLQFLDYIKKPIRVKNEKILLNEMEAFNQKYNALSKEEQKLISYEYTKKKNAMKSEKEKIINLLDFGGGYYSRAIGYNNENLYIAYGEFKFLNEDQLEALKLVYDGAYEQKYYFAQRVNELLKKFKEAMYKKEETMIGVDFTDYLKDSNERKSYYSYKYMFNLKTLNECSKTIFESFKKVEDEQIKKILEKIGIY